MITLGQHDSELDECLRLATCCRPNTSTLGRSSTLPQSLVLGCPVTWEKHASFYRFRSTSVLWYGTPFSSVPPPVIVIVFPSCEMTRVVVAVTLSPLFVFVLTV